MRLRTCLLASLALIASPAALQSSHAAITVVTSEPSFLAAVSAPGVDTFAGFPTTVVTNSPITRNAGPYPYTATSTTGFFGAGTPANPALSTNVNTDAITFSGLGAANAVGGLFFGSDLQGSFVSATIVVTVTDTLGATTTDTLVASPTSFLGFLSTGAIASVVVATAMPGEFIFPTVDNLTIAMVRVAEIPEPGAWALLLAGSLSAAACVRRRRGMRWRT
jgi:hypothetical protein